MLKNLSKGAQVKTAVKLYMSTFGLTVHLYLSILVHYSYYNCCVHLEFENIFLISYILYSILYLK